MKDARENRKLEQEKNDRKLKNAEVEKMTTETTNCDRSRERKSRESLGKYIFF